MAGFRSLGRSCLRSSTKAQILTERTERGIEYAGPLASISRESIRLSKGRTRAGTAAGLFQVHLIFWCACRCRSVLYSLVVINLGAGYSDQTGPDLPLFHGNFFLSYLLFFQLSFTPLVLF